jgi:hypothetical protein
VADFAVRFNDFSGGDWGDSDPAKAKSNQFSGKNVLPYGSGLLGVRAGWKLLNLAGKVAGGNPPNYTGITRGFELMRDHLTLVIDTKSYDIYWDLTLAPGGTLPNQAPATLPGSISASAFAQLLYSNDGGGVKEWMLVDGKLCLKSTGATPTWQLLSAVSGSTAPPNPLSIIARWGLYLVAIEQTVPWRLRFSQVDSNGPNFLVWPAANYLDLSTTDPVTAIKGIFNLLYLGKASGWFAVSGVLGVLASVRELAYGNGPIDNRAASVTTDNRVAYWPLQKVPAFWNGERVQLVGDQRMDPRTTWFDTTPITVRTDATPDAAGPPATINTPSGLTELQLPDLVRQNTPTWAASGAKAGGNAIYLERRRALPRYTSISIPPGASNVVLDAVITADNGFTANGASDTFTAATTATYEITAKVMLNTTHGVPGHYFAVMVNGVEQARSVPTTADFNSGYVYVSARVAITAGQTVSLRAFNADTTNITMFCEPLLSNQFSPYMKIAQVPAVAAGARWVCPLAGTYDLYGKITYTGYSGNVMLLRNGLTIAQASFDFHVANGDPVVLDLPGVVLALNDEISLAVYSRDGGAIGQVGGAETDASPLLKFTSRATAQQVGTLGMFGNSVIVTPTEKLILMAGDDGAVTKVWRYNNNVWTRHEMGVLIAGLAPADVRMSYLLPEHVVFATKRSYTAEALKVWSINHDIDRPAFLTDQWGSPYDESMAAGNLLVKGEASMPMWFDGQGRQCRVRSVVVQFVKWNQGIAGGVNQISARVDSVGPYNRGVTPGIEATWSEPMSGASNDQTGTEDSWRFNVGEQGWGNGFQLVFTALYGVAIREAVVLVDVRTERT